MSFNTFSSFEFLNQQKQFDLNPITDFAEIRQKVQYVFFGNYSIDAIGHYNLKFIGETLCLLPVEWAFPNQVILYLGDRFYQLATPISPKIFSKLSDLQQGLRVPDSGPSWYDSVQTAVATLLSRFGGEQFA